ncbi:hypothetical protein ACH5RR_022266 [Cinchona calisaya]|uniref:BHLH domain-containing protein n=1 Tax=Cinchona calisaya TaxID=153742 RepID=A0ABD2Z906_9GENT
MENGEWISSFSSIYSSNEEADDFLAQLLDNYSLPNDQPNNSNVELSPNYFSFDHQMYTDNYLLAAGDDFLNQDVSSDSMESDAILHGAVPEGMEHEKTILLAPQQSLEDKTGNLCKISKKRSRTPLDVQKNKRMVKAKNNDQQLKSTDHQNIDDGERSHPVLHRQSSSSCLSEDESINASQEFNGGIMLLPSNSNLKGASTTLNSNGKTRASKGSATDPQSLYARKRREKINERLRTLQNLVPNGTKVDISTMLEEAVQYVKFLQLQIKLLSSDDLWMYAPIAYNGMNLGLDLKIDATLKS